MVKPFLQKLCCGVPEHNLKLSSLTMMIVMNMMMMMMMMMMRSSHHPRKMGRKEMAVGRIQAKAIIKQATLTVIMMVMIMRIMVMMMRIMMLMRIMMMMKCSLQRANTALSYWAFKQFCRKLASC